MNQVKTLQEILKMDTSNMSLTEMISMLDSSAKNFPDDVLKLRLKHEEDTGVPMEEDELSVQENILMNKKFGDIVNNLRLH